MQPLRRNATRRKKEFDDYVERHSDSPGEEEHEGRSISRSWSIRL